jgi:SlyX protein
MPEPTSLNLRVSELEIENAYQRETIESLSETVSEQWKEIDRLSKLLEQVLTHLRSAQDNGDTPGDEPPPPHY